MSGEGEFHGVKYPVFWGSEYFSEGGHFSLLAVVRIFLVINFHGGYVWGCPGGKFSGVKYPFCQIGFFEGVHFFTVKMFWWECSWGTVCGG